MSIFSIWVEIFNMKFYL
uniref:Uncharacterized protein n=1 Tax=Anguilla anguilla TaxID=7936 RepID=A0A0E9V9Z2_ANGAN